MVFEEGGVLLWIVWGGTLKSVMWYFKEGYMVLWRWLCGTLKRVMWYFEYGGTFNLINSFTTLSGYEPYYVMHTLLTPAYDERFIYYGGDKQVYYCITNILNIQK